MGIAGSIDHRYISGPSSRNPVIADRYTILVVTLLSILTISSSGVILFGMPRISIISIPFSIYLFYAVRGRLNSIFLKFSIIYLVALMPGTIHAVLTSGQLKTLAAIQALAALVTFTVLSSYMMKWLLYRPDAKKKRDLEKVLIFFFIFSVLELLNYELVANLRNEFYNSSVINLVGDKLVLRELSLYGGRPTGFFSETSHFARFIGLMVAAYMMVTRFSFRSFLAFGIFLLLVRSISFFFAAPAMAVAIWPALRMRTAARSVAIPRRAVIFIPFIVITVVSIIVTQSERISAALNPVSLGGVAVSSDGSLNARILFPLMYLSMENTSPIIGKGLTPQDEVQSFTLAMTSYFNRTQVEQGYTQGISASIVMLAGLGIVGGVILVLGTGFLSGRDGLVLLASFLMANLISSGYNSVASLVPSAILLSLVYYGRCFGSNARGQRRLRNGHEHDA